MFLPIFLQAFCDPDCTTQGTELENPDYCPAYVYGGGPAILFIKKCITWADPSDPAEWITQIQAGNVVITPCGNFVKDADTTASSTIIAGCQELTLTRVKSKNYTFTSNQVAKDGVSHYRYVNALECASEEWNAVLVTCCSDKGSEPKLIYHLADAHVDAIDNATAIPTTSIGHVFTFSAPPTINPGDPNTLKSITFTINIPRGGEFKAAELPGVTAAIRTELAL